MIAAAIVCTTGRTGAHHVTQLIVSILSIINSFGIFLQKNLTKLSKDYKISNKICIFLIFTKQC